MFFDFVTKQTEQITSNICVKDCVKYNVKSGSFADTPILNENITSKKQKMEVLE